MSVASVRLLGFQPDLAPDTPGVIASSSVALPTDRGIGNGVNVTEMSTAMAEAPHSGAVFESLAGDTRIIAAGPSKIYELIGATSTDRSRAGYSTASLWTFAQFGDTAFAANKNNILQASTGGAFDNATASAPYATIVVGPSLPNREWVMLFDIMDGVYDLGDEIWWSPVPLTSWTPSVPDQIGKVRITDVNGKFTAALPYRDGVLAWKAASMYLGTYVGGSDMWSWVRISSNVGCLGPKACCVANDVVYFADSFGLWQYDGSYPRPMPGAVHQWFANTVASYAQPERLELKWDKRNHRLWVNYGVNAGLFSYAAFNPRSQLWTQYGTIRDAAGAVGVSFLISPEYVVTAGRKFASLSGYGPAATLQLGAVGDDYRTTLVRSARPHWLQGPGVTTPDWIGGTLYHARTLRDVMNSLGARSATAMTYHEGGSLDAAVSDYWLAPAISITGGVAWEFDAVAADVQPGGE